MDQRQRRSAAQPASNTDPLIGTIIHQRYRVLDLIARGGMGRVYKAEQFPLNRIVALKVLDLSGDSDTQEEFRTRFTKEAAACARLSHPNTIRIFDYAVASADLYYIAMEYVDGRTLHQAIHEDAPMGLGRVIHIAREIAHALKEAHSLGLVHRDLKPSNVMLMHLDEEKEHVKVLDFGLVKELRQGDATVTRHDSLVGSPSYMSPEQIRGGGSGIDGRSDIYSLGIVMYACLTGRTPFHGPSSVNVLMAHLHTPPPLPSETNPEVTLPPLLEKTVMTCLAKNPDDRFATIADLLAALRLCEKEIAGQKVTFPPLVQGRMPISDEPSAIVVARPVQGAVRVAHEITESMLVITSRQPIPIFAGLFVLTIGGATALGLFIASWINERFPIGGESAVVVDAPADSVAVLAPAPGAPPSDATAGASVGGVPASPPPTDVASGTNGTSVAPTAPTDPAGASPTAPAQVETVPTHVDNAPASVVAAPRGSDAGGGPPSQPAPAPSVAPAPVRPGDRPARPAGSSRPAPPASGGDATASNEDPAPRITPQGPGPTAPAATKNPWE
jgi:serine/threonine-protein kinase